MNDYQAHWDDAYHGSDNSMLGWYQSEHSVTLNLIKEIGRFQLNIIDVGAGVSTIFDELLKGDNDVSVLDISKQALQQLKIRYGDRLKYHQGDLCSELDIGHFDIWHDRAVLHFLLEEEQRTAYVANLNAAIPPGGHAIIETFSLSGEKRCCNLDIFRYDEKILADLLGPQWELVNHVNHIHLNPFGGERPYVSTLFKRI